MVGRELPEPDLCLWKRMRRKAERMERSIIYSLAYSPQSTYLKNDNNNNIIELYLKRI
jgi:hypothetical protein